jgi:hypothetical protein
MVAQPKSGRRCSDNRDAAVAVNFPWKGAVRARFWSKLERYPTPPSEVSVVNNLGAEQPGDTDFRRCKLLRVIAGAKHRDRQEARPERHWRLSEQPTPRRQPSFPPERRI